MCHTNDGAAFKDFDKEKLGNVIITVLFFCVLCICRKGMLATPIKGLY
jgi:hypothetical protein